MSKVERPRMMAIGVVPTTPFVLWDYDLAENEKRNEVKERLEWYATGWRSTMANIGVHWCIRETKHGFHLIMQVPSWDDADYTLKELYRITHKQSIMSCRKQRLRVSPKWDMQGREVSPVPKVVSGCEHRTEWWNDIKKGRFEFYYTYDNGIDTGMTEEDWKRLGEKDAT